MCWDWFYWKKSLSNRQ